MWIFCSKLRLRSAELQNDIYLSQLFFVFNWEWTEPGYWCKVDKILEFLQGKASVFISMVFLCELT